MATSNDHPGLPFVQAKGYTSGRPDGPPLWIVVHDMEAGEFSGRAESTAAYFANPSDGRDVSAHYCVDNDSVIQCVDLNDSAWTVGNRPGNNRGINWELSGFARQTREEWLDQFGLAMFAQMAPLVRADSQRFNIPLRRCTVADLVAFRPGITSHNDLRVVFGGTTHTDPGPNFPWDVFLAMMTNTPAPPIEGKKHVATAYKVDKAGTADDEWWISDGITRRPVRSKGAVFGPATKGMEQVVLTEAMRADAGGTWDEYLTAVAGPIWQPPAAGAAHKHPFVATFSGTGTTDLPVPS